ncbi:uncharacterized protein [Oscarella lobularis]|uniref:uncharacterized protein n=1 Tax=Oscarella lobularis TaxID=121494 RepID=UPI0033142C97
MAVAFIALMLACSLLASTEDFHPERTRYIDSTPPASGLSNFLFRGNMPINGSQFAYVELVETLRKVAQTQANVTLPGNFTFTDLSYLNPSEYKDENVERKFFELNSSRGNFVNWIIVGDFFLSPQDFDEQEIKEKATHLSDWQLDNLPDKMAKMRAMLYTKQSQPNVIYTHCEAGTDRTGEMSGAYYMKYQNMTYQQAMAINNHVQSRPIYNSSRNALEWYCYYLKYVEGRSELNCTNS